MKEKKKRGRPVCEPTKIITHRVKVRNENEFREKVKKVIKTLAPLCLLSLISFSQPYFGMGLSNNGVSFRAGITDNTLVVGAKAYIPLQSVTMGRILALEAGIRIKDLVNVTIGGANIKREDLTKYETINEIKPIYSVEFSKSWWFIEAAYCKKMIYGAGVKLNFRF